MELIRDWNHCLVGGINSELKILPRKVIRKSKLLLFWNTKGDSREGASGYALRWGKRSILSSFLCDIESKLGIGYIIIYCKSQRIILEIDRIHQKLGISLNVEIVKGLVNGTYCEYTIISLGWTWLNLSNEATHFRKACEGVSCHDNCCIVGVDLCLGKWLICPIVNH